jgi:hypothetical protein
MPPNITSELPRLVSGLQITPFQQGKAGIECFLVETGEGVFLVNQRMRHLLEALAGESTMAGLKTQLQANLGPGVDEAELAAAIAGLPRSVLQRGNPAPRKTPFHFSFRLLEARFVGVLANLVRRLYSPVAVTALAVLLVLELPWLVQDVAQGIRDSLDPSSILVLVLGTGLVALVHELGHAAACAWYGLPPGEIGFGLYLVFPVFYADVTKTWRLPPWQRAVVDAGGLYFQFILIALSVPLARIVGENASQGLRAFILFNACLIFHNLNPLFKMDGYWILSDLAGLPNLHQRTWRVFQQVLFRKKEEPDKIFPWAENKKACLVLNAYALAILAYGVFMLIALPRWCASQLQSYPALAAGSLRAMASAWAVADYHSWLGEFGRLALASLTPGVLLALLGSLVVHACRQLSAGKSPDSIPGILAGTRGPARPRTGEPPVPASQAESQPNQEPT